MEYFYKVKHKFVKLRKKGYREIENFGFNLYKDEEGNDEIYAISIVLKPDNHIVVHAKKIIEHFYKEATEEQRKEDFSEFEFADNEIVMNEKALELLTRTQLCFSVKGKTANILFVNGTDAREYYSVETLDECAKEMINYLLENKVIYKTKATFTWKIRK